LQIEERFFGTLISQGDLRANRGKENGLQLPSLAERTPMPAQHGWI
jgi:hypothetical protein